MMCGAAGESRWTNLSAENQVIMALRRISRAIGLHSFALVQQHGLTAPQSSALQAVGDLQPVPISGVARSIHLSLATVRPSTVGVIREEGDAAMVITVECVNADIPEQEITLTRLPAMIGRSPEADVHLDDSCVSRQHCVIDEMNGRPLVRDLGSKNGTFINGEAVQKAVVRPDDRISIGRINLRARC
jgi:hypothetical protein